MKVVDPPSSALRFISLPVMAAALVGLVLSVVTYASVLAGWGRPLGSWTMSLDVGVFPVWIPALLSSTLANKGKPRGERRNSWKVILRGCPRWMRWAAVGFIPFSFVNFLARFLTVEPGRRKPGGEVPDGVVLAFAGQWIAFYAIGFAILYSACWGRDKTSGRDDLDEPTL